MKLEKKFKSDFLFHKKYSPNDIDSHLINPILCTLVGLKNVLEFNSSAKKV